jgi:hypothetical protein
MERSPLIQKFKIKQATAQTFDSKHGAKIYLLPIFFQFVFLKTMLLSELTLDLPWGLLSETYLEHWRVVLDLFGSDKPITTNMLQ